MWQCLTCGEESENNFDVCWNCQTPKGEFSAENRLATQQASAESAHSREFPTSAQSSETVSASKPPAIAIGIIIFIVGVALIIISSNLLLIFHPQLQREAEAIVALQGPIMFFGVVLLIVGGIIFAVGISQFMSTQPTTPPAPTTQPVVTRSVSPKSVELGNTPVEVQSVMGQPDKIINLGARVIHVYKDMKIIYVDGKVSDVQL